MKREKAIVSLDVMVHWGDMDAMCHVNNIVYLKWVESTRLLLFEKLVDTTIGKEEIGPILAWSDMKYISPVVYPDTVHIDFNITEIGEDRLHGEAKLYSKAQNKLVALSKNTLKAYNLKLLKKAEIPEHWRTVIQNFYASSI